MTDITWNTTTIKLSQLTPWADNPKTSTGKQQAHLTNSFSELGQFQTVAISPDGDVYDGHQRLSALLAKHGGDYEVLAMQSSRALTETERRKIAIYSRQIGAWDWDILSGWEPSELIDWGFDSDTLGDWGRDYAALSSFLESEQEEPEAGEGAGGIDPSLIPDGDRYQEQYGVIVICESAAMQRGDPPPQTIETATDETAVNRWEETYPANVERWKSRPHTWQWRCNGIKMRSGLHRN